MDFALGVLLMVIREVIRHENDQESHHVVDKISARHRTAPAVAVQCHTSDLLCVPGGAASDGVGSFQKPRPGN